MLMMTNHESDEHWPLQCHDVTLWCQSREMFCSPMDQEWSVETSLTSPRHKVLFFDGIHLLLTFKIWHLAGLCRHHWRQYCDHGRHHAWTGQGQIKFHSVSFLFQPIFMNFSQTYLWVLSAHRPCQELSINYYLPQMNCGRFSVNINHF